MASWRTSSQVTSGRCASGSRGPTTESGSPRADGALADGSGALLCVDYLCQPTGRSRVHTANHYYGHAHLFADYVGIPFPIMLDGYLQHGWNLHDGFAVG